MSDENKIAVVQRGVNAFAKIEKALEDIHDGFIELQTAFKDCGKLDMLKESEVLRTVNALRSLSGKSASVAGEVYQLHEQATKMAKRNGADVALPDGYVVVMGGGGR